MRLFVHVFDGTRQLQTSRWLVTPVFARMKLTCTVNETLAVSVFTFYLFYALSHIPVEVLDIQLLKMLRDEKLSASKVTKLVYFFLYLMAGGGRFPIGINCIAVRFRPVYTCLARLQEESFPTSNKKFIPPSKTSCRVLFERPLSETSLWKHRHLCLQHIAGIVARWLATRSKHKCCCKHRSTALRHGTTAIYSHPELPRSWPEQQLLGIAVIQFERRRYWNSRALFAGPARANQTRSWQTAGFVTS